jgi:3-oxoacyl-[acyl-carrier protein] reductase
MGNKVAVVTGGSRGIGRAIAEKLSEAGYDLVLNYRSREEEALAVKEALQAKGGVVEIVQADVSQFADAKKLVQFAKKTFGRLDLLVNNAGITKDALLPLMKEDAFDAVIQVNLKGTFNCMKHAMRVMMKQKSGVIINISSVVGLMGNIGQTNYAASKAGVIGMMKSVAKEGGSFGIRANAIAPGFIKTAMTDNLPDQVREDMLKAIPLGDFGSAEDVANLVKFLASDDAKYITGQVINVDGGMVM